MHSLARRFRAGILLLGISVALTGCGYGSRTLLDGKTAVPAPVLPMLPMADDQRMMIQGGLATTWAGTTAGRMSRSSAGPLIVSPRLLGAGGNFQWRHKAFFAGVEVAGAVHEGAMASAMADAMAGVNVAGEDASFLAWAWATTPGSMSRIRWTSAVPSWMPECAGVRWSAGARRPESV